MTIDGQVTLCECCGVTSEEPHKAGCVHDLPEQLDMFDTGRARASLDTPPGPAVAPVPRPAQAGGRAQARGAR